MILSRKSLHSHATKSLLSVAVSSMDRGCNDNFAYMAARKRRLGSDLETLAPLTIDRGP